MQGLCCLGGAATMGPGGGAHAPGNEALRFFTLRVPYAKQLLLLSQGRNHTSLILLYELCEECNTCTDQLVQLLQLIDNPRPAAQLQILPQCLSPVATEVALKRERI